MHLTSVNISTFGQKKEMQYIKQQMHLIKSNKLKIIKYN